MSVEMEKLLEASAKLADAQAYVRHCIRLCGVAAKDIVEPVVEVDEAFLDREIELVDFGGSTTRIRNWCRHHALCDFKGQWLDKPLNTIRDLIDLTPSMVLRQPNIGRLSYERMRTLLAAHGLSFKEDKE